MIPFTLPKKATSNDKKSIIITSFVISAACLLGIFILFSMMISRNAKFHNINPGMTTQQVGRLLGSPSSVHHYEVWLYEGSPSSKRVSFWYGDSNGDSGVLLVDDLLVTRLGISKGMSMADIKRRLSKRSGKRIGYIKEWYYSYNWIVEQGGLQIRFDDNDKVTNTYFNND